MHPFTKLLIFTLCIFGIALAYYLGAESFYTSETPETFLTEIGEEFGEVALWLLIFIYARTLLKLFVGQGHFAQRLVPESFEGVTRSLLQTILIPLNKTHAYVGIATLVFIFLHVALVGWHFEIVLFQVVLLLLVWQGLFGFFLRWRFSPRQLKQFSYLVHAQFLTGIMIGIFSYVGHWMVD